MRCIALGLGSLFCLARLAAQQPAQQPIEKVTVEGTVVDDATGLPIERALVTLYQSSLFTGPDGRFEFPGQVKMRYMGIQARRPGYEGGGSLGHDGSSQKPLVVRLKRYAEITGKVLNGDGEPVQGLRVQAYRRQIESGRERLRASSFWTTDDLGSFRLAEMPSGEYLVRVMARPATAAYLGDMRNRGSGAEAYIAQYYPGVADQSAAQVLKMEPGQALQLDFTVSSRPAVSIRGRIANHVPYQTVTLELSRPNELPMGVRAAVNAANGEFHIFDVPAGRYELSAKRKINEVEERGIIAFEVGTAAVTGLSLNLGRPVDIDVSVEGFDSEFGRNQPIVFEFFKRDPANESAVSMRMNRSGKFNLKGVWPGHYRVWAHGLHGQCYVAAITSNGKDLLRTGLTVPESSVPSPIEVQLAPGAAQLEVSVLQDGRAAPNGQVLLFGDSPEAGLVEIQNFLIDGKAVFAGLAPGTYGVLALPPDFALEYWNPDVVGRYASRMNRITVRAEGKESIQINLASGAQK